MDSVTLFQKKITQLQTPKIEPGVSEIICAACHEQAQREKCPDLPFRIFGASKSVDERFKTT